MTDKPVTDKHAPIPAPELTRPIAIDRIGTGWRTQVIETSADERAALAARFELLELPRLSAEVRLRRARAGRYVEIDGTLRAAVVQTCVVTLEPVAASVEERFALLLGPIGGANEAAAGTEAIVDLDEPEPLEGDAIDVGELVAQQLSLALDPYPRAPDAPAPDSLAPDSLTPEAFGDPAAAGEPRGDVPESPFAVLRGRGTEPKSEADAKPAGKSRGKAK
jgi:hypothetical protein